ncbi:MAG: site-specific DNA-methyltransferase [Nanoarchaeota archaeon]|nr:site-specific DNA-methyltransferase [Nanoarchaeota archaeon]MBU1027840.1 site-specific DNA-methyltransferase [Nanoarchaeota archaeon]
MQTNKIYCVDVLKGLRRLKDNSVNCIITSPPYWALRDYGNKNQIGLEDHPQDYINKIVEVMKECKRVIKPTGTIWFNLGDSYYSRCGNEKTNTYLKNHQLPKSVRGKFRSNWLQHKQKLLIQFRIAIKCQDELGLILRNDITWVKQWSDFKDKSSGGRCMPSGVKDRLTTNSEALFFFAKSGKYYFDLDSVRIPYRYKWGSNPKGKNPGDCIMFPLEPNREKHFAMFPSTLPEFCIKAGCPKKGIVLDPFMGSGTTALVCKKLNRNFIGFDLNKDYIKIALRRIKESGN